jgi:redox-sensitive bicupin YhaK (pirin superfamily)
MMDPRYRGFTAAEIPEARDPGGAVIKVIAGTVNGVAGAVRDVVSGPEYLDVSVPAGATFSHPTKRGHTVFAYVFEGAGHFDERSDTRVGDRHLVSFDDGDAVTVRAGPSGVRFLLVSGKPIGEPIACEARSS